MKKLRWSLENCSGEKPPIRMYRSEYGGRFREHNVPVRTMNSLKAFFFKDLSEETKRGMKFDWSKVYISPKMIAISGERNDFHINVMVSNPKGEFTIEIEDKLTNNTVVKSFCKKNSAGIDAGRWLAKLFFKWRDGSRCCPQ